MKKQNALKILFALGCFSLMSCSSEEVIIGGGDTHDSTLWFTENELEAIHLSNLTKPTGLSGDINSSTSWFNDGYSFSQGCDSLDIFNDNANIYFNYFETNFDGKFGVANSYAYGSDTTYYNIVKKSDLNDYYNTNPSQLYKFYYVSNTNVDDNGFLLEDSVFIFEIRYEFSTTTNNYQFKMFIEKANKSNNGVFTYKYKLA